MFEIKKKQLKHKDKLTKFESNHNCFIDFTLIRFYLCHKSILLSTIYRNTFFLPVLKVELPCILGELSVFHLQS